MTNPLTTLHRSLSIFRYYLQYGILITIAYLFNKSFTLHHPDRLFPTNIFSPRNATIHSFIPTNEALQHLHPHLPSPPPERRWLNAPQLLERQNQPLPRAITLEGNLSGPALRQGMIITQQHHTIYIQEELGRWPTRDDYIATTAYSLTLNIKFRLFIPVHQIDQYGIHDESPLSPFRNPIPLVQIVRDYIRLKPSFQTPLSPV